jgi:hypothetical protein
MAYDVKKQPTDPAFGRQNEDKSGPEKDDGHKEKLAGQVLAELGGHVLKARWDHPYPISARQDDEELRRRKRK